MEVSTNLQRLVQAAAPLWAGEAEVVRTYFESSRRSRETDLLWIRRQCKKEFWDSIHILDTDKGMFMGPIEMLRDAFPKLEVEIDRHEVLELTEALHEEFRHYVAFADVYDLIRIDGDPKLTPQTLQETEEWVENADLGRLRQGHRKKHGDIGRRACRFTEGGYCSLYSEGMKRAGKGKIEDAIAEASKIIYDDEISHMAKGIVGLDGEDLSDEDWDLLIGLVTEQMQARIRMRNAQFSEPVGEDRIQEIFSGEIEPVVFDYERANMAA